MSRIAGVIVGVVLCGLVPAIIVGVALNSRQTQFALNLPGAGHGFGNLCAGMVVLVLGGALGGVLGARWAVRSGTRGEQDTEQPPQRGAQGSE